MGYSDYDVYYQPEKFGLTPIGEIEWDKSAWQFDITAVWMDDEKNVYYASDSGCSCPSPFDAFATLESLTKIERLQDLIDYLSERVEDACHPRWATPAERATLTGQVGELICRVRDAIQ